MNKFRTFEKSLSSMLALFGIAISLISCARTAHLYPLNSSSKSTQVLNLHFMSYGTGHGSIEINMPDGELLKGEYSIVRGGMIGFGNTIGTVYGSNGVTTGQATTSSYAIQGGSPGIASAHGNNGTSMQCEFYNDNFSGHGYGACKSSKDQIYRLQY